MFKFKLLTILIMFFGTMIGISQETKSDSIEVIKSSLVFSELEYDFGTVRPDTVLNHIFTLKNVSSDTIKINKVTSS